MNKKNPPLKVEKNILLYTYLSLLGGLRLPMTTLIIDTGTDAMIKDEPIVENRVLRVISFYSY